MTDEIKIEKGVPVPPPTARGRKYPWHDMEVGDSFFIAATTPEEINSAADKVTSAARAVKNRKFTVRKFADGVRVWRIA